MVGRLLQKNCIVESIVRPACETRSAGPLSLTLTGEFDFPRLKTSPRALDPIHGGSIPMLSEQSYFR